jgi:hypothetical protein
MPEKPCRARWAARLERWGSRRLGNRGTRSRPSAVCAAALNSGLANTVPSSARSKLIETNIWEAALGNVQATDRRDWLMVH